MLYAFQTYAKGFKNRKLYKHLCSSLISLPNCKSLEKRLIVAHVWFNFVQNDDCKSL